MRIIIRMANTRKGYRKYWPVNVMLTPEEKERLTTVAAKLGKSNSSVIRSLIADFLKEHDTENTGGDTKAAAKGG